VHTVLDELAAREGWVVVDGSQPVETVAAWLHEDVVATLGAGAPV
jgi:hypothetical protein